MVNGVLVSVVIDHSRRGLGLGTILMNKIEEYAANIGCSYMYLWTSDAVNFYKKIDYLESDSTSIDNPALKNVNIQKFENLLQRRVASDSGGNSSSGNTSNFPSVWLRKR